MYAIKAARLFDGTGETAGEQQAVLVEGGLVHDVRPAADVPSTVEVVDFGAATVLPGLVDAHVHLGFDAGPDVVGRLTAADDGELFAIMRASAATALAAGVTTVRDLGDRSYVAVRLRGELAGRPGAGPQVLAAGPPITTPMGHCWFLGGEAQGVDGVRRAVREHAARGVDVIKVMATGGEMTAGTRSHVAQFDLAELRAIAEEAHALGLPVTAHAHGAAGIANAIAAGFDMVEHGSFMTADGAAVDPTVLDALVRAGMPVSATLGTVPGPPVPPRIEAIMPQLLEVQRALRAAGVRIVATTDAGIGPAKPHDVLPFAAATMVDAIGYAPVEALRAVTSAAADACRVGDRKGRIAAGYDADLLVVDGDPLVDIAALRAVAAVYRAGVRVR